MGQRLVIQIETSDGDTIASCYWQRSGYTGSAISIAKAILETMQGENFATLADKCKGSAFQKRPDTQAELELQLQQAINAFSSVGAGFSLGTIVSTLGPKPTETADEIQLRQAFENVIYGHDMNGYPFRITNRNDGMIEVTPDGIADEIRYSEMDVWIDVDSKTADVSGCFWEPNPDDEDETPDEGERASAASIEGSIDLESATADDLGRVLEALDKSGQFVRINGELLGTIA